MDHNLKSGVLSRESNVRKILLRSCHTLHLLVEHNLPIFLENISLHNVYILEIRGIFARHAWHMTAVEGACFIAARVHYMKKRDR